MKPEYTNMGHTVTTSVDDATLDKLNKVAEVCGIGRSQLVFELLTTSLEVMSKNVDTAVNQLNTGSGGESYWQKHCEIEIARWKKDHNYIPNYGTII